MADITSIDDIGPDMAILEAEDTPESKSTDSEVSSSKGSKVERPAETEEVEEPKEIEEKESEETEEKEGDDKSKEKVTPIRAGRPTVTDIKAKYPEFFKDFPDMRHMLFREGEYSNIFPTVDDAKEAAIKATNFDNFSTLVTSGKPDDFKQFLNGVKEVDGLPGMAANFLPALYKTDRDLYFQVTQPVAESLLSNAFKQGLAGNENLKNAALVLSLWAFGDTGFAEGTKKTEPPKPPEVKDDKARSDFIAQRDSETHSYVNNNGMARLKAEVARGFDPNEVLPEFTRDLLIERIIKEIGDTLEKDERHMKGMNSLWRRAHQASFAGDWKDRILTAYLSGARSVMPAIRARVRDAAFGDHKATTERKLTAANKGNDRRDVTGSSSAPSNGRSRVPSAKAVDWSRTSDMDILEDKVTYRK